MMRDLMVLCLLGLLVFSCGGSQLPGRKADPPPNIIFLLTDDQRWDALGYAGNEIIHTPHLNQLAREGAYFSNAYVTTPICAVSRASILSGQYARRHGIWDFGTHFSDSAFQQTYPMLLREAGYYTGFVGKYGVGWNWPGMEEKWDYWKGYPGQGVYWNEDSAGQPIHMTRLLGDQALEFLGSRDRNRPFCLSVSFKAPHVEDADPRQFLPDSIYEHLYTEASIPRPLNADSRYWEAFPSFFRENNEARLRWYRRFSTDSLYQQMVKDYYRLVTGVDSIVGELRAELERQGLAENTVILFTSDHGFYLGEYGMAGKWYAHEVSIRVPMILYDPRLPETARSTRRAELALNIDVAPTLLALAGLKAPVGMQGRDLSALLAGKAGAWREDFLFEHLFEYGTIPRSDGVVGRRSKLVQYIGQEPVYEQLFDLKVNPLETENYIYNPAYEPEAKRLRLRLEELRREAE